MKSPRGAANIQRYNTERLERNLPLVKNELKKCRRHKLSFSSVGKLALYIDELTGIHRTTLIRNIQYKQLLIKYLANQDGPVANIPDRSAPPEVLNAKLLAARLELSNLREKVKRLEANKSGGAALEQRGEITLSNADYIAFVDTAMALTAVLERIKDTVLVDLTKRTIEDLAAPPSRRVIVGSERATSYITWLAKQQGLFLQFMKSKSDRDEKP